MLNSKSKCLKQRSKHEPSYLQQTKMSDNKIKHPNSTVTHRALYRDPRTVRPTYRQFSKRIEDKSFHLTESFILILHYTIKDKQSPVLMTGHASASIRNGTNAHQYSITSSVLLCKNEGNQHLNYQTNYRDEWTNNERTNERTNEQQQEQ